MNPEPQATDVCGRPLPHQHSTRIRRGMKVREPGWSDSQDVSFTAARESPFVFADGPLGRCILTRGVDWDGREWPYVVSLVPANQSPARLWRERGSR